MRGAIVDCGRTHPAARLSAEVCVIGSGPAGATAASDLARAGHDVLLLEEGPDLTGRALTQRDAEMYDQLYMERGGRFTADMSVTILQGRALGGGSVINVCDVVEIGDGVLDCWRSRYGLTDLSSERMRPYREGALADLSASVPDEESLNRNNRLLRQGAAALGWRGEVMRHNRVGCAGLGTCMLGCPIDAKRNARFVAIPRALDAGARVLVRARALRLEPGAGHVLVRACRLDPRGHHELDAFEVRATHVALAAGAVGSAALLLRSGLGNEHVGRHLSLQPQLPITAVFEDEVRFIEGIPQSYAVTQFEEPHHAEHGWWGFRIEAISGTPGIVASLMPVLGRAGMEMMTRYSRFACALCLTPDAPSGRIEVKRSGRIVVRYELSDEQRDRLRRAAKAACALFLAAGASEVLVPSLPPVAVRSERDLARVDAMDLRPPSVPLLSAHQQGGVRMGASSKDGAADPEGLLYGVPGVSIVDSGCFPTSASSHTMAPIITMARYLTERIPARLSKPAR